MTGESHAIGESLKFGQGSHLGVVVMTRCPGPTHHLNAPLGVDENNEFCVPRTQTEGSGTKRAFTAEPEPGTREFNGDIRLTPSSFQLCSLSGDFAGERAQGIRVESGH